MQANIRRSAILGAVIGLIFTSTSAVGIAGADEVVGAATTVVGSSRADRENMRFTQEVLEILRDKGEIDQAEYEELKKKEQTEHDKAYSWKYSNGLQLKRNDGLFKIKLGGRVQIDFATLHPTGLLNAAVPGGNREAFECRRCRIYFSGDLYDRIIFKSQFDFANGDVKFNDVYIGMKKLGPVGTVKFGHMKEPFSLEEITSSKYITFMERSLGSIFDSARNIGLMAQNHVLNKRMTWALGLFAPTDDHMKFDSIGTALHLSGRLTGLPYYANDGEKLVHLGVSISHQFLSSKDERNVTFAQRPESHLAAKYLSFAGDNSIPTKGNTLLAVELAWVQGPFSLQSEFKPVWVQDRTTDDIYMFGSVYANASYFITGEHRNYVTKGGYFGRVSPIRKFDPLNGGWGAWEVAARYSYLDMIDGPRNGGKEWDITAGVNWYLFSQVRITANYVYAKIKDTGDLQRVAGVSPTNVSGHVNIFQLRAQLEF